MFASIKYWQYKSLQLQKISLSIQREISGPTIKTNVHSSVHCSSVSQYGYMCLMGPKSRFEVQKIIILARTYQ